MAISDLIKIDDKKLEIEPTDILCFVTVNNEIKRIEYFYEHYRKLGVDKFFFVDNGSVDGTEKFIIEQEDSYCFHTSGAYFVECIAPPAWTNTLANAFGHGHWCVTVDADELFVYPQFETLRLQDLCRFLSENGDEAMYCTMVDMYPEGPVSNVKYHRGQSFVDACPYFDPEPGWIWARDGECPPDQMFGGVRERIFWKGEKRQDTPPCINKIPLVHWQKGMKYLHSMHFHSGAKLASITGSILHFKFLEGFVETSRSHLASNVGVKEKSLEERKAYLEEVDRSSQLVFKNEKSVYFRNSQQLVELGWMRTTEQFQTFVDRI